MDQLTEPICSKQGFYSERFLDLNLWSRKLVQSHCTPSINRYWKEVYSPWFSIPNNEHWAGEIEPNLVNFKEFNLLQTNENGWTDVDRRTDWMLDQKAAHFNKFEFPLLHNLLDCQHSSNQINLFYINLQWIFPQDEYFTNFYFRGSFKQ